MDDDEYVVDAEIEDGDEDSESEPLSVDIEAANMVPELAASEEGRAALRDYAYKVRLEYDTAKDSMEPYLDGVAADLSIFYGEKVEKSEPFENMAHLNIPIALENCWRLINRAEGELFEDWTNVFGVEPVGTDDIDTARLLSQHGNWQISTQIPDFKRQQRRGMLMYYVIGDVTFESYWDPANKCNRHEALTPEEFYTPYANVSVMPDWSDVPYRGRIYDYYKHDMEAFYGIWDKAELDRVLDKEAEWEEDGEEVYQPIAKVMADHFEMEMPTDGPAPYRVLRHETYCELPGQPRERLVRFTMDLSSGRILHMSLHELPMSWSDLGRYEMQVSEHEAYQQASEAHKIASQGQGGADGFLPPVEPPQMPSWMTGPDDRPRQPDTVPLHQYSHAVNIEPLRGCRGIGYGQIQAAINRFANTALNQHADAATLSNWPALFADADADLPKRVPIGGGVVTNVRTGNGRSVKDMIHVVPVTRDTGTLLEMVKWGQGVAQSSIQSPDVLSGESGKSGESGRGLLARIGEATKNIGVATRAYASVLEMILKHNARMNGIHLDEEQFFLVTNDLGLPQERKVGASLYRRAIYTVKIRADMKFTTDGERVKQADELVGMVNTLPWLQGNLALAYEVTVKAFEARGVKDLVKFLGQRPPAQQQFGPPMLPPGGMPPGQPGTAEEVAQTQANQEAQQGSQP